MNERRIRSTSTCDTTRPMVLEVCLRMAAECISPYEVRDILLRCFSEQHGARFAEQERELGLKTGDRAGMGAVEAMVRLAFQQVGGSFEKPSRAALTQVVNLLSERSLEWGGLPEAVLECHATMMRQIAYVQDVPQSLQCDPEPPQGQG